VGRAPSPAFPVRCGTLFIPNQRLVISSEA